MKLRLVPRALRSDARKFMKADDVESFFGTTDSMNAMMLLCDNHAEFRQRGLFERALLCAWSLQKSTVDRRRNFSWAVPMRLFLTGCDRARLLAASDPLPSGDVFTIYRGIWDTTHVVLGPSWTLSLAVAQRFAHPFGIDGGAVYETQIKRSEILAYINESGRGEQEVLVVPVNRREKRKNVQLF